MFERFRLRYRLIGLDGFLPPPVRFAGETQVKQRRRISGVALGCLPPEVQAFLGTVQSFIERIQPAGDLRPVRARHGGIPLLV
ncbi:MAG: hypothetical protein BWX88_05359 [Planctomycetes bacterium ADurb.Bin126]|nr:MAG: hypothetical protein BWX88_05359 [Planctomycetes bacterium ADurb.Bin126]